jgi:hypothetical protein
LAQDEVYFTAALWEVPRAKWPAYVEWFEKNSKPVLERMLAEGVINAFGLDSEGLHSPEGYSHISWLEADSVANLEKAQTAVYGAMEDEARAELASMAIKHQDDYGAAVFSGSRTSNLTEGYWIGSTVQVKEGKGADFRQAWEAWVKPVYEQLLADGTIVSYSLSRQHFHTEQPGLMTTWYAIADMAMDEKVDAAFEAAWTGAGEIEGKARQALFREMTKSGSHRDQMNRIIHLQVK